MKSNIWLRMSLSSIRIVDVRTVCSFGETESKDRPLPEKLGRFLLGLLVLTHPDGLQAEDGHLEAIPVTQAIKDQEFAVGDVAGRIPTPIRITVTIGLGCKQLGKDSFFFNKIDKLLVSNLFIEILEELGLPHGFEESDCLCHNASRIFIDHEACVFLRLKQKVHFSLLTPVIFIKFRRICRGSQEENLVAFGFSGLIGTRGEFEEMMDLCIIITMVSVTEQKYCSENLP